MSQRIEKINELIQKTLSNIILKNLSFKEGVFVTITKVDTSRDLRYARVFISVFPEREIGYATKTLEREAYAIQGKLNRHLHTKPLPKIEFKLDMTEVEADKIEKLLREIKE